VELRFSSHLENRSIGVSLLLAENEESCTQTDLSLLERLLPEEYTWTPLSLETGLAPCPQLPQGANWRVARLVRRIEMFDLPACFPWLHGRSARREASQQAAASGTAGSTAPQPSGKPSARTQQAPAPSTGFGYRRKRRIPILGWPIEEQFISQALCLPLLGEMKDHFPDRRRLCQEMQEAAPVVLSITLHPIDEVLLEEDRATATYLREWLAYFSQALAEAGYARIDQLRAVYDRYWLPITHLCSMTVRIAAIEDSRALSVAHCLCARLGGMRAFEVRAPSKSLSSLEPIARASEKDGDALSHWLRSLGVVEDRGYSGFLTRMPHLYTLEEAERLFRLPFARDAGLPGIPTRPLPPFHAACIKFQPRSAPPPADSVRVGLTQTSALSGADGQDTQLWHSVPIRDLCKHALIVGSTGSGKTVFTTFLLRELRRLAIPFLVIEPVKTEYYDRLRPDIPQLVRWRFEGADDGKPAADFLPFDPMRLQPGVTVARHVSYLKSCFEAAFPLTDVLALVLENGLRAYYTRLPRDGGCGLGVFSRGGSRAHRIIHNEVYPSFQTFTKFFLHRFLEETLAPPQGGGRASPAAVELLFNWRQLFVRRFDNLLQGPLGEAIRRADSLAVKDLTRYYNPLYHMLQKPTVLELDGLADNEQKSLMMAFLLTFLFERRQAEDLYRREGKLGPLDSHLSHVLIVEEAHRLLARSAAAGTQRGESVGQDSRARAVSLFVDMLAEIRAFGQGIVVVEQIPTKIVLEAVKNTNLKIMLRLTSRDDRDFLGEAMNFNEEQKRFVTSLCPGEFVAFAENVDQPLLLRLPRPEEWEPLFP